MDSFAGVGAAAGVDDDPPMFNLIVLAGPEAGSASFFSGVELPPMLSLIVGAGAGAWDDCSRSIGA